MTVEVKIKKSMGYIANYLREITSHVNRRKFGLMMAIVLTCGLLLLAGFNAIKEKIAEPQIYTIAGLFPLSGLLDDYGNNSKDAALLALAEVNAWLEENNARWRLKIEFDDTGLDSSVTLQKLKSRFEGGIIFFVGPFFSSAATECLPFANENQLLMISPSSTAPALALADDWLFRFCADDSARGRAMAAVASKMGAEHIIIAYRNDSFGTAVKSAINESSANYGIEVYKSMISFDPDQKDFSNELSLLDTYLNNLLENAVDPDKIIFCLVSFNEDELFLAGASRYPSLQKIQWLGCNDVSLNSDSMQNPFAADIADRVNYIVVTEQPINFIDYPNAIKLRREYLLSNKGNNHDRYAYITYDIIWSLARAIDEAGYDAPAVREILPAVVEQWSVKDAASGPFSLNEFGDRLNTDYAIFLYNEDNLWEYAAQYCGSSGEVGWLRDIPRKEKVEKAELEEGGSVNAPEEDLLKVEAKSDIYLTDYIDSETINKYRSLIDYMAEITSFYKSSGFPKFVDLSTLTDYRIIETAFSYINKDHDMSETGTFGKLEISFYELEEAVGCIFGPNVREMKGSPAPFPYFWNDEKQSYIYLCTGFEDDGPFSNSDSGVIVERYLYYDGIKAASVIIKIEEVTGFYVVDIIHIKELKYGIHESDPLVKSLDLNLVYDERGYTSFIAIKDDKGENVMYLYEGTNFTKYMLDNLQPLPTRRYIVNQADDGTYYISESYNL